MKNHRTFVVAAFLASILPSEAGASTRTLKFGHVGAPGSLMALSAEEFARRANQTLAGKAKVIVFGSSQLGKDKELLQKLKLGTVDFALPSTVMSSVADEFGLFEMPYLINDRDHMARIEKELFWSRLAPRVERRGYKIIAVWENGFRHITNNRRPIVTPADLKGIKLRTPMGEWRVKMFRAYDANPTPMAFSEVFTALQTGTVDGQENPYAQIYSAKFHEVQRYLSMTRHVYSPAYVTVSAKKWARLPASVRTILEQTARETQAFVYAQAARLDEELLAKIKQARIEVNTVDYKSFARASKRIYDEFAKTVPGGKDLIEKAQALAASL